jgi:hypothetical protein
VPIKVSFAFMCVVELFAGLKSGKLVSLCRSSEVEELKRMLSVGPRKGQADELKALEDRLGLGLLPQPIGDQDPEEQEEGEEEAPAEDPEQEESEEPEEEGSAEEAEQEEALVAAPPPKKRRAPQAWCDFVVHYTQLGTVFGAVSVLTDPMIAHTLAGWCSTLQLCFYSCSCRCPGQESSA